MQSFESQFAPTVLKPQNYDSRMLVNSENAASWLAYFIVAP